MPVLPGGASTAINVTRFIRFSSRLVDSANSLRSTFGNNQAIRAIQESIANNVQHLSPGDIAGAVKDILGRPVVIDGKTYDHLQEVTDALRGLRNNFAKLNRTLGDSRLTPGQREAITETMGLLSEHVDRVEKILDTARSMVQ